MNKMEASRFILDNGLRLVHVLDESTEMVHVNILYGVGAKNEEYGNKRMRTERKASDNLRRDGALSRCTSERCGF